MTSVSGKGNVMAVYTEVGDEDLIEFIANYDIQLATDSKSDKKRKSVGLWAEPRPYCSEATAESGSVNFASLR